MKRRGGYTLVEVMTAGAVLILVSLIAARGFVLCGQMISRNQSRQIMEQRLELRSASGMESDMVYNETLTLGDLGEWEVNILTYQTEKDGSKMELKAVGIDD